MFELAIGRRANAETKRSLDDMLAFQIRQLASIAAASPGSRPAIEDCCTALRLVGRDDLAALLSDSALLVSGLVTLDNDSALAGDGRPRSTITLGVDELRVLLPHVGPLASDDVSDDEALIETLASLPGSPAFPATDAGPSAEWLRNALPALVGSLAAALRADVATPELDALLDRLRREVVLPGPARPASHPEKLDDVIARLVHSILREGLLSAYECAFAPLGSGALLHMAIRLHPSALGPCFANAGALFSLPGNLFDFVRSAGGDRGGRGARDLAERCAVLLSMGFNSSELRLLAIELGDRGFLRAAAAILERVARRSRDHYHNSVVWDLRDTAIDNEDLSLALAAQRLLIRRRPDQTAEWNVLAQLEATAGNRDAAETIFSALLARYGESGVASRLAALRAGRFGPFRIVAGFGSLPGLVAHRRARLAVERSRA